MTPRWKIYDTATRRLLVVWLWPPADRSFPIVLKDSNRNPNPARW